LSHKVLGGVIRQNRFLATCAADSQAQLRIRPEEHRPSRVASSNILLKLHIITTQQPHLASLRYLQPCNVLIDLKKMMLRSIGFDPCAPFSEDLKITSKYPTTPQTTDLAWSITVPTCLSFVF
jgi:hypothetical protein